MATATRVKAPAEGRFDPKDPRGFVVQSTVDYGSGPSVSYWYGQLDCAYPNTWGQLDIRIAVFPSKAIAEMAFGRHNNSGRYRIVSVAQAVEAEVADAEAYAARRIAYLRGES